MNDNAEIQTNTTIFAPEFEAEFSAGGVGVLNLKFDRFAYHEVSIHTGDPALAKDLADAINAVVTRHRARRFTSISEAAE